MGVAGDPGVGPDLEAGALRADAREAKRRRDVHVGGKAPRRVARAAFEDLQRRLEPVDVNAVIDEIRCARESSGGLAGDHRHRRDAALGRAAHRVEPHHRAARHHDLRTGGARGLDEVGVIEQSPGADGDQDLPGPHHRLRDLAKHRGRRALDHDVRASRQIAGGDDIDRVPESRHPVPRPRMVAGRYRGEHQAVDLAIVEAPGDLEADGAETADANAVRPVTGDHFDVPPWIGVESTIALPQQISTPSEKTHGDF